jgi:phosphoglucosamine mutase
MEPPLFGTDGVRGPAGRDALSPPSLARLGLAVAHVLRAGDGPRRALVGRDTRRSGPAVVAAFTSGLLTGGVAVTDGGVLPTPAVALLVRRRRFDLGVAVSASHNPWRDNGLKLLGRDGRKLDDATESRVEAAWRDQGLLEGVDPEAVAAAGEWPGAAAVYTAALLAEFADLAPARRVRRGGLAGLHVVVDAAHGAQSGTAAGVLRALGARVTALHDAPDGRNINVRSGALHPGGMCRAVRAHGADLGVAFDGDADRLQLADERGRLLDGDAVLAALAPRLLAARRLPHRTVVGTSMTNGALERRLAEQGLRLVRTPVGDRHVVAEMAAHGYGLGGEPSGHVVVPRRGLLTGDALRAALLCLRVLVREGVRASQLAPGYRPWPLEIVSLAVARRQALESLPRTWAAIEGARERLGDRGRIVVRYSGTEPKVRVMVEAPTRREVRDACAPVLHALREEVGAR